MGVISGKRVSSRLDHHDQSICQKMFHQETLKHIVTAVWGRTFMLESDEWLKFFYHDYVKVDILCESLPIKEIWA